MAVAFEFTRAHRRRLVWGCSRMTSRNRLAGIEAGVVVRKRLNPGIIITEVFLKSEKQKQKHKQMYFGMLVYFVFLEILFFKYF